MLDKMLPLAWMNVKLSNPSFEDYDFLSQLGICHSINKKFESPDDKADAYDGAFVGVHLHNNYHACMLLGEEHGYKKEDLFDLVKHWYDKDKNLENPFHFGLKNTLDSSGLSDFYKECMEYLKKKRSA